MLKTLPAESVRCCVTSPPYWGLRDYGHTGQFGLEKTFGEYLDKLVLVFEEVKRVLTKDGTLWVNMGDSYAGSGRGLMGDGTPGITGAKQTSNTGSLTGKKTERGELKPKDLIGQPWALAFALRGAGWYLRQDIIWSKPNPMPESVTDRPARAHEYIFLLSKSREYFYDHEAIKEPATCGDPRKPLAPGQVDKRGNGHDRGGVKIRESVKRGGFEGKTKDQKGREAFRKIEDWRNKRSVWEVTLQPFPEAHFATFPENLIKPCILAGSAPGDTVLDPFSGSGTTGLVATELGRKYVGIELNPEYVTMSENRINASTPGFQFLEEPLAKP